MKKLLTLSAVALLAVSAFGQGAVNFNNYDTGGTPAINAKITDFKTGAGLSGTEARVALLGGKTTATAAVLDRNAGVYNAGTLSLLAHPTSGVSWVNFRTGTGAGYFVGGSRVVTDVNAGDQVMLQMVAWTGNFDTWQAAYAAAMTDPTIKVGCSASWLVTTPADATSPTLPRNIGLQAFSIAPIPEPTTMALAGLGAAALLIFRRRK